MTRLQIRNTGRWSGRGFFRRIFGSGAFAVTPIDVAIKEADVEKVVQAALVLQMYLDTAPASDHRLGSLANLEDVRTLITVKAE